MRNKTVKKGLLIVFTLGLLALGGYGGRHWYRILRQHRLVNQAREFLVVSDRKNALLCLERALLYNPKDPNACRLMAELAEATHSPGALIWRSRVVEYNPGSLDDRLYLAQAAIRARDYTTASNTLEAVDTAGKQTSAYHNVAGGLAVAVNKPDQAEAHFREIARLEPTNLLPLVNIAVLRLRGTNVLALAEARSFLRSLTANPTNSTLRIEALRELIKDAVRHRDESALTLSRELLQQTNSVFADQLLRLDALREAKSSELKGAVASAQITAVADPVKVAELASWEIKATSGRDTLAWLRQLPLVTQTNHAVAVVMTECYTLVNDWRGLAAFLGPQKWGELEFSRHAFLAHALRSQELDETAKVEWQRALKSAIGHKQDVVMLLGFATQWGWSSESEELLWDIVNKYPGDRRAFQALAQTLFQEGRTRSLLQLYGQVAKGDPSNLPARNNIAYAALLLDAQELKPHELARDVYQQAPTNPACATTYGLSLLLQKKNAEAIKVFESLNPKELVNPSVAGCYGLALQAAGQREKAKKYLEIGFKTPMLPEQRKLIKEAMRGV